MIRTILNQAIPQRKTKAKSASSRPNDMPSELLELVASQTPVDQRQPIVYFVYTTIPQPLRLKFNVDCDADATALLFVVKDRPK
ncbi:MAG: hypothetical protein IPO40_22310 [Fibrobacteres bacterium]|nr:hypothetical protein [Fibrobacterota bacterium]